MTVWSKGVLLLVLLLDPCLVLTHELDAIRLSEDEPSSTPLTNHKTISMSTQVETSSSRRLHARNKKNRFIHSRYLAQRQDSSTEEDTYSCTLSAGDMRRMLDRGRRMWSVTDTVLTGLGSDLQRIVNCTSRDDTIVFQTRLMVVPTSTIVVPWNLTFTAQFDESESTDESSVGTENRFRISCPLDGSLIVIRSAFFTLANAAIVDCNKTESLIVYQPQCSRARSHGLLRLVNVTFSNTSLYRNGHTLDAGGSSCARLTMENVTLQNNTCSDRGCIVLSSENDLNSLQLYSNKAARGNATAFSIFTTRQGSNTVARNVTSEKNQLRTFHISIGNLTLTDSHFQENKLSRSFPSTRGDTGGIVLLSNLSTVFIENSSFEDNYAISGGCIYALSSNFTVNDCRFRGNEAGQGNGGGLYLRNVGQARISSSQFFNNFAREDGGAICSDGSTAFLVVDSEFFNNVAEIDGGGISIHRGNFTGQSLRFENNTASNTGGGFEASNGEEVSMSQSQFIDCKAESGGALRFGNISTVSITRSSFISNEVSVDGGAIDIERVNITVSSSLFESNYAISVGGGLQVNQFSNAKISNCTFNNNLAPYRGGSIDLRTNSTLQISRSIFNGSRSGKGGAVNSRRNCSLSIERTSFSHCEASNGAGVAVDESVLEIRNANFTHCLALDHGGALFPVSSTASIEVGVFENNQAIIGGAMEIDEGAEVYGRHLVFRNNKASESGGAVFAGNGGFLDLQNIEILNNEAPIGGGLHLEEGVKIRCSSVSFRNNVAGSSGGAVCILDSVDTACFSDCNFSSNEAGEGGAFFVSNASLTVSDSAIHGNYAVKGGGVYLHSANATLDRIRISDNEASGDCGGLCVEQDSNLIAEKLSVLSNSVGDGGGGIGLFPISTLLCHSCLIANNTAVHGAGMYVSSMDTTRIVAQLQDSSFENNSASLFGGRCSSCPLLLLEHCDALGGIEFNGPQGTNMSCDVRSVTCTHIVLLNTTFIENYANQSGSVLLTTETRAVATSCQYNESKQETFLDDQRLAALDLVDPERLCKSWQRNRLASEASGNVIGTLGRTILLNVDPSEEVKLSGNAHTGYTLENVQSGKKLPRINVTILDQFGVGPAPTSPYRFEARMSSADEFFPGFIIANITGGSGYFEDIVGFKEPESYAIHIYFGLGGIEEISMIVQVRECRIGEEPTVDRELCQECDSVSYNFYPGIPNNCKACPEEGNCTGRFIVPNDGHWHKTPCQTRVKQCIINAACRYENRQEKLAEITNNLNTCNLNDSMLNSYNDAMCNKGYGGLLCGSCKKGFGLSFRFHCLKCPKHAIAVLTLIVLFCYLLGTAAFTIHGSLPITPEEETEEKEPSEPNSEADSSSRDTHTNVEMAEMSRGDDVSAETSKSLTRNNHTQSKAQQGNECELTRWRTTEIFKIMINFLQVTSVADSMDVNWTEGIVRMFEVTEYASGMTTTAVSRPIDCLISSDSAVVRSVWRTAATLLVPIAVIIAFFMFWGIVSYRNKRGFLHFVKRSVLSIVAVLYISYLGLTKLALRAFYCVKVYASNDPSSKAVVEYWAVDTAIECYKSGHPAVVAICAFVLFLVSLSFPFAIACTLSKNKKQNRQEGSWKLETMGFIFRAFKEDLVYWESIVMFRKACLSVVVVFSYSLGSEIQGLLALIILLLCLCVHFTCLPYRKEFRILNYFEAGSLLVSCLTFTLGQFFSIERCSDTAKAIIAGIIILINSAFVSFLLFACALSGLAHMRVYLQTENVPISPKAPFWKVIKAYVFLKLSRWFGCLKKK